MYLMEKDKLIEKVKAAAPDNRISCGAALKLAEAEKVSSRDLGDLLDEIGVKVSECQLGCFPRETPCSGADTKKKKFPK